MKKILSAGLIVSVLLLALAAWLAVGNLVEHKIHQREVGAAMAPTPAHPL